MTTLLILNVLILLNIVKSVPYNTTYSTNFTSYDASYWTFENECAHCGGSGHGDDIAIDGEYKMFITDQWQRDII